MKRTVVTMKSVIFAVGLVFLLTFAASANTADQSIWFQNHGSIQAYDLAGGPTCSFSADAGESIYFQNQYHSQSVQSGPTTLCSVTNLPGDSVWFRTN
jgi:hypothetical protein